MAQGILSFTATASSLVFFQHMGSEGLSIAWMRFRKIHSLQQSFKVPSDARMQARQMLIALEWNAKR